MTTSDGRLSARLKPLSPELPTAVRTWATELRALLDATSLSSVGQLALNVNADKGSISYWLSGKRVPGDTHFLDKLLQLGNRADKSSNEEIRASLARLQDEARNARHPHAQKVREAERQVRSVQKELAEKMQQFKRAEANQLVTIEDLRAALPEVLLEDGNGVDTTWGAHWGPRSHMFPPGYFCR